MTTAPLSQTRTATKPAWLVILLCWLIVVLDGYDLIVYGTTLPAIMAIKDAGWNLNPTEAGFMGSLVFVGALFGRWAPATSPTGSDASGRSSRAASSSPSSPSPSTSP